MASGKAKGASSVQESLMLWVRRKKPPASGAEKISVNEIAMFHSVLRLERRGFSLTETFPIDGLLPVLT